MTNNHDSRKAFEEWGKRTSGWVQEALDALWDVDMYRNEAFQSRWETWQAAQQHFIAVMDSPATMADATEKLAGYGVWFPNNRNSRKTMVQVTLSAVKQKLGA